MPRMSRSRCCQCYPPVPDIVSTITVTSAVSGPDQRRSLCKAHQLTITMSGIKLVLVRCLVWWRRRWLLLVGVSAWLFLGRPQLCCRAAGWLTLPPLKLLLTLRSASGHPPNIFLKKYLYIYLIKNKWNQSDICCLWEENDCLSLLIQNMIFSNIYILFSNWGCHKMSHPSTIIKHLIPHLQGFVSTR